MSKKNLILLILGFFSLIIILILIIVLNKNHEQTFCNASKSITNGNAYPCTSSLANGASCKPTCDPGYYLSGNRSCKDSTITDNAVCIKAPTYGPPTQEQLDLAKKTVKGYSDLYNKEPFIMFVNYTTEKVVARLGSGNGLIPCSSDNKIKCNWGDNPGISKIHNLNDTPTKSGFNTGIIKSYEILDNNQCWIIKIPLTTSGSPDFWDGNSNNSGKRSKDGQNLYFAYGLTGNYININGVKYTSIEEARKYNAEYKIFPECESNSLPNLAVGNQSQLELTLSGNSSETDLTSVNGVSRPFYIGMYNSKSENDDYNCQHGNEKRNFLYCNYDRTSCDFPEISKVDNTIKKDKDGLPYNCLQPGVACQFYVEHPDIAKKLWNNVNLDETFTFTDPHGTTWNTKGCVPNTNYCTKVGNTLKYMGMDLVGGSCELLNASNLLLDGTNWVTGGTPTNANKDEIWQKYGEACGNFGSTSDRLRVCKYDITKGGCPIRSNGSCLTDNGTGNKDSWSPPVLQKFCESCHTDTCTTYCQAYDDYWGTMSCPLSSTNTPNVVVITY